MVMITLNNRQQKYARGYMHPEVLPTRDTSLSGTNFLKVSINEEQSQSKFI